MNRRERAAGALVGSAVGDALGAPYEFGPPGAFSAVFPPGTGPAEMRPGGGWNAGEATDDTQMALLVAHSLLERGRLDEADLFARFRRWAAAEPKDIGVQTEAVLTSGLPWDRAAAAYAAGTRYAAGNGSLMRCAPAAIRFASAGRTATMDAARRISALTHGDPAAGEGCAVLHELIRAALAGVDPRRAVPDALACVVTEHRPRWATVLADDWDPGQATESNGAVWAALGSAVWVLRTTTDYETALRAAIDLGDDTDTVAAVTGALAGAVYGLAAIPAAWRAALHVPLPGWDLPSSTAADLVALAHALDLSDV